MSQIGHSAFVRSAIVVMVLLSVTRNGSSQDSDAIAARELHRQQQYLTGLVERQMFSLAATYCRDRVREQTSPRAIADWTCQWIGVLTEHAKQTSAADRAERWPTVHRVATEFHRSDGSRNNPWSPMVDYQAARSKLVEAELLVQPCELGLAEPNGALKRLRSVSELLTQLEMDLSKRMRSSPRSSPRSSTRSSTRLNGPSLSEIKALRARVFNSRGKVHLYQAKLYDAGSPDRVSASIAAIGQFERVSPGDVPADLWDQVRWNLLAAMRLKGDYAAAGKRLDRYLEADVSVRFRLRTRAERIRLAMGQDRFIRAQSLVALNREIDGHTDPELDLACLETIIHQWHAARDAEQATAEQATAAAAWKAKAMELTSIIERDHRPYWLHRAEMLISSAALDGPSDDFDVLQRTARNLYLRGRIDEALAAYDRGAQQAEANGKTSSAFDMAFQAAAIQQQRGETEDAHRRFQNAANGFPSNSNAPRAHELAILLAASQALKAKGNSNQDRQNRLSAYEQLLTEHLAQWPSSPSAQRAQLWRAKLYEYQERYWLAAKAYTHVESAGQPAAMFQKAKVCFVKALEQSTQRDEKLHDVISSLRALARRPSDAQTSHRSDSRIRRRLTVLVAAELQLRFSKTLTAPDLHEIVNSMELLLGQDAEAENPQWRDRAHAMRIAAHVRLKQWKRAAREMEMLRNALSETWFELLAFLAFDEISLDGSQQELGEIQLMALAKFRRHNPSLSAEDENRLAQWRADALMRTGNFAEAQVVLKPLVAQKPDDLRLREVFAQSLLRSDNPSTLGEALAQWRIALKQSKPQSRGWFRAKYGIATAYRKLGQSKRASEMIRVLKALYPNLGGDRLRSKFDELLEDCDRGSLKQ